MLHNDSRIVRICTVHVFTGPVSCGLWPPPPLLRRPPPWLALAPLLSRHRRRRARSRASQGGPAGIRHRLLPFSLWARSLCRVHGFTLQPPLPPPRSSSRRTWTSRTLASAPLPPRPSDSTALSPQARASSPGRGGSSFFFQTPMQWASYNPISLLLEYTSNGPCRAGPAQARHEGHQSKPDTIQYHVGTGWPVGWLMWSKAARSGSRATPSSLAWRPQGRPYACSAVP